METDNQLILAINGGSSSIKFAMYQIDGPPVRLLSGTVDRIGSKDSTLSFSGEDKNNKSIVTAETSDHQSAGGFLIDWLERRDNFSSVKAVGHRIVHGMEHAQPEVITHELIDELHRISPYDMDHLPAEVELIEAFGRRYPKLPQVACFDTAFHCTMPRVAKLLPIPRRFDARGIRRYGFHGLSYAYLIEELARVAGEDAATRRVILAHLGNGASLAAVHEKKSIDTSMGFTPAGGVTMGTRPGDLDPGVAWYIMKSENLSPKQFNNLINHESGLLGISESSSDMHDLLNSETRDARAAEAVALFCYQVKKWIGAFAAALGGVDTLVFAGGIGENAPLIRSRICKGLNFLGVELNEVRNAESADVISADDSRVTVRVIRTNEELMIVRSVKRLLGLCTKEVDQTSTS